MQLERYRKKSCLHHIMTADEEWIHYNNPKRKKTYAKYGQPAKSTAKPIMALRECSDLMKLEGLYYELLKPSESTTFAPGHEAIIFHHEMPLIYSWPPNRCSFSGMESTTPLKDGRMLKLQMGNTLSNIIVYVFLK